jgi:tetratricopeptide (TPR) repeat protein
MQPWEFTTHRADFVEIYKNAVEIWTPSTYSRQSFINSGLDFNKVQVIPNGIDPELFKPTGNSYKLQTGKRFKLLFVGGTIFRKGIDILLSAYKKTFTANDNICLVIKDLGGDTFYKGQNAKEYIERMKSDPNNPEIEYIDSYLDEEQMASLYRACDLFACPYRGEGFSLPTLEAMACGLPVVVTDGGATDDFVVDSCGWKVPSTLKSIGDKIDDKPMTAEAFLLEPDEDYLCRLLKSIYADPSDVFVKGLKASYIARTTWTWDKASAKALSRLDYLFGTNMAKTATKSVMPFEDSITLLGMADIAFEAEKYKEAIELYNNSIASGILMPKHYLYALNKIAMCSFFGNEIAESEDYLQKALEAFPGNPDSLYLLSLLGAEKDDWDSTLETISPLMDKWVSVKYESTLGFGLDSLLTLTARGLNALGDQENSLRLFGDALKINPNNYEACFGAGKLLKEAGMTDNAREMLEWAVKINPNYKEAIKELKSL